MGKILGLLLAIIALATVYMFLSRDWFPAVISEHGPAIDAQFKRTLFVVGVAFTLAQLALGYAVFRFGRRGKERAVYTHGSNKLEATWTIVTAAVFITLAVMGQMVWADMHLRPAPADSVKINLVAQQFQFTFHYPGADQEFGRTDPNLIDDSSLNYVGLDAEGDPKAADDIQSTTMVIPVNRPVEVTLRSKDVIHNFFVPQLRFKQDTVPGMAVKIHFKATQTGKYEVVCAELCGQLHYNMRTAVIVVDQEEYDRMSAMPKQEFTQRLGELSSSTPVSGQVQ
ncbi:MAG TPA: cytochrome c oxidase subunit II [Blastocatellia bacterium]|nr:cytochrome c oxidase subunit II [Blastocatellia bacterium]